MRCQAKLRMLFQSLFRRRQLEADLREELRDHLEQEIQNNVRAGMSREEATSAARRLMGFMSLYGEECRDARGTRLLVSFVRDVRYGSRTFRRTPLFTASAILTLALGIGATTTVFTFVENILLRPIPARDPQQLVSLNSGETVNFSYPNYLDFRERNRSFSSLIAYRFNPVSMGLQARENFRVWGYEASGNYFGTLGIVPELGRFFTPAEDTQPGASPVVVLSDRYWRSHLAGDRHVIGRAVKINGSSFTTIGIAPPNFLGTELIMSGDYWVPMSMEAQIEPGNNWLRDRGWQQVWIMGRLKPGLANRQAEEDLNGISQQLAKLYPNAVEAGKFKLTRPGLVGQALRRPIGGFGIAFMSIAAIALLLACINIAGMLLARASDRHREIGIRWAVGASRMQLLRQLMTESLLLGLSGGIVGLAIAFGACHLFSLWSPSFDIPINNHLHPDAKVLSFTFATALLTTVLFGLAPALQAVRVDFAPRLKDEGVSTRLRRLSIRDLLVAGQIALSVILVISSVLVIRSLQQALTLNLGFNPNGAVAVSFDLSLQGYDQMRSRHFTAELLQRASALPGLQAVGIISNLPLRIGENDQVISRADRPLPPRSERRSAVVYNTSPGYLRAAGTRLLSGREISSHDREGAPPAAIVNQALVHLLYGNDDGLGKRVRMGNQAVQIIGVVETGKYGSLGEDPQPAIFVPIAQTGTRWTTLVARTPLPPAQATDLLRKAVLDLDSNLTLFNTGSLADQLAMPLFPARAAAIVLGVFGVLAVVLAATGLFALVSYSVSRRLREIGIRMTLGARPFQVLSSILKRTIVLCAIGISIGMVGTLAVGRLLSAILYGVSPRDPASYATAFIVIIAIAALACWNPAARAIRVDPARTLREQ